MAALDGQSAPTNLASVQIWRDGVHRGELQVTEAEAAQLAEIGFELARGEDLIQCEIKLLTGAVECTVGVSRDTQSQRLQAEVARVVALAPSMFKLVPADVALCLGDDTERPLCRLEGSAASFILVRFINLLANGSFDAGRDREVPDEWRRYGSYGDTGVVTSELCRSGTQCIKYWGWNNWQLIETQPVHLKHSEEYEFRFWARSTIAGQTIRSEFLAYSSEYSNDDFERLQTSVGSYVKTHALSAAETWEHFTHRLRASSDNRFVRVNLGPRVAAGAVYHVDDVELVAVPL